MTKLQRKVCVMIISTFWMNTGAIAQEKGRAEAQVDPYTRDEICDRLNQTDSRRISALSGALLGVGLYNLMVSVPELKKEFEARKQLSVNSLSKSSTEIDDAIAFYDRENDITQKLLGSKSAKDLEVTVLDGESSEEAFTRAFGELEDKELGSSSLNNLLKKYKNGNQEAYNKLLQLKQARIELIAYRSAALNAHGVKNVSQLTTESRGYRKFKMKDALTNQSAMLESVNSDLLMDRVRSDAVARYIYNAKDAWFYTKFKPRLSEQTKIWIQQLDGKDLTPAERVGVTLKLKKTLLADLKESDLLPKLDPRLKGKELAKTVIARDLFLSSAVDNSLEAAVNLGGFSALEKSQAVAIYMPPLPNERMRWVTGEEKVKNQSHLRSTSSPLASETNLKEGVMTGGALGEKRAATCGAGGLVALGVVGAVSALSHYSDNNIPESFAMNLPKQQRDGFAQLKKGKSECKAALVFDPTLFTAVKSYFQTKDGARSPAGK